MSKLTPWFPPQIKPVHKGVYERKTQPFGPFSYWDGEKWGGWGAFVSIAIQNKDMESSIQSVAWRGLARKPKGGSL